MNSPTVKFNEIDNTLTGGFPAGGISGVSLITKRGPLSNTNLLITTWEQFKRIYGGFRDNTNDPAILLAKRALEGGSALRVNRLVHYDDITDPSSAEAEYSQMQESNVFVLDTAVVAGGTLVYTSGSAISAPFDTDGITTMRQLAAAIEAGLSTVRKAIAIDETHLIIVPSGAAITGDTLAITGTGADTATRTTRSAFGDSIIDNTLFSFTPKYPGEDYDNLEIAIEAASNGQSEYFDLRIRHITEPDLDEFYPNLRIVGAPSDTESDYLDAVVQKSKLVDVVYNDLSAIPATPIVPEIMTLGFHDGDDGISGLVDADIIGDSSAKNGFYAFDGADDITQVAVLNQEVSSAVHIAGASYADARKDLQYFGFLFGDTEADVLDAKPSINTSYAMLFAGTIKVLDPQSSTEIEISSLGDILGIAAYSEKNFGLWYSFAGLNRGVIRNSLGAVNKWGAAGNSANLDQLANHQINVVINKNKTTVLWGSFTGQLHTSQLSLANIRRFHIGLKKTLGPAMERFIEEPCDILMFKQAYLVGKRIMDPLIPARAIFDYRWEGDQFADNPSQFKVNDPNDVSQGKYKVILYVKDIASLQEFTVDITLTPAGINFDDLVVNQ